MRRILATSGEAQKQKSSQDLNSLLSGLANYFYQYTHFPGLLAALPLLAMFQIHRGGAPG